MTDEVKEKQAPEGENASEGVSASVPIVAPVNSTSTNTFMSENEKKNSTALRGTSEGTLDTCMKTVKTIY